jgi:hypothetical protein
MGEVRVSIPQQMRGIGARWNLSGVAPVRGRDWELGVKPRRRVLVGSITAVLLAGAAIPLLRTQLGPIAEEKPPVPAPPIPRGTLPGWLPSGPGTFTYNVRWADRDHAYAIRGTCATTNGTTDCGAQLLATEDAAHWERRTLPAPDGKAESGLLQQLYVLGQEKIVVEAPRERWYSDDGGRSWRKVPIERGLSVQAIPEGAVLEPQCAVVTTVCRRLGRLLVMLPESGRSAALANPPPLANLSPGSVPTADGAWWVSGLDPGTGRPAIAVSRDAGRSWTVGAVPAFDGTPYGGLTVTATPGAAYATAITRTPDGGSWLLAIFRSTDGGQTWERTWQASGSREPRSINGVAVAAADGKLIVATQSGTTYVSTDGGRTFQWNRDLLGHVEWNRGGYFVSNTYPSTVYTWSPDGVYWLRYTVS